MEVKRISNGDGNFFFGFHDLVQTDHTETYALALETACITRPPFPGERINAGIIELASGRFKKLHATETFNYPQGARQQWVAGTSTCLCNDRVNGKLVCHISDAASGGVVETLPFPVHCHNSQTHEAFFIDYDRLHLVGGYGYVGGSDAFASEDIPSASGIFKGWMEEGTADLLVSLHEIAACGEKRPVRTGYPHYATHLVLNPSRTRLAFLHRYRVIDGGEITRLMTIGIDGKNLRCLAKGFLSHFDWLNDDEIFIWGKDERRLCEIRESLLWRIPGVSHGMLAAKQIMRTLRTARHPPRAPASGGGTPGVQNRAFWIFRDADSPSGRMNGAGVLREDGHPMLNPRNPDVLVNDTYPDDNGVRTLMFYDLKKECRCDIGHFKMSSVKPDADAFDWRMSMAGIDTRIIRKFPHDLYLFTRSGLHCDLHPRWSADGRCAFFDSIHEGTRQIYAVPFSPQCFCDSNPEMGNK